MKFISSIILIFFSTLLFGQSYEVLGFSGQKDAFANRAIADSLGFECSIRYVDEEDRGGIHYDCFTLEHDGVLSITETVEITTNWGPVSFSDDYDVYAVRIILPCELINTCNYNFDEIKSELIERGIVNQCENISGQIGLNCPGDVARLRFHNENESGTFSTLAVLSTKRLQLLTYIYGEHDYGEMNF